MKIVAVFGSPRKGGNSDTLAEAFLQEAEGIGSEVERFRLKELKYGGCIACNSCKTKSETCVLKDDLIPVLEAVRKAETLLVATPVYFFDLPSQVKAFMDRWYSFFKPNYFARKDISRLPSGKNVIFVTSQRAPESLFMDFIQRYNYMLKLFGFKRMHLIRGCKLGDDLDDADKREDLLEKARETASKVLAGEPSDAHIPPYSRQGDKAET